MFLAFLLSLASLVQGPSDLVFDGTGTITSYGNTWQTLGTFVVPDKPADDGTWEEFHIRVVLDFGYNKWITNNSLAPTLASSYSTPAQYYNYAHTSLHFRDRATQQPASPGWSPQSSLFNFPALQPGESFQEYEAKEHSDHTWYFWTWQFPTGPWIGHWPGQVVEVDSLNHPQYHEWPGWQNDPTGMYPYGQDFVYRYKIYFWWEQQPQ